MADFYGTVQGERGQAQRMGRRSITTKTASWDGAVQSTMTMRDGAPWLTLELISWHGRGPYRRLYDGPLSELQAPALAERAAA